MAATQPVPCVPFAHAAKQHYQTIVAKVASTPTAAMVAFAQATIVHGDGAVAVVDTGDASPEPGLFLVLTLEKSRSGDTCAAVLKAKLLKLPVAPHVRYVRPPPRRLQRLFHSCDASATRADREKA